MFAKIIYIMGLAVGLSADAFAVSICKGLSVPKMKKRHALIAGGYFGVFQAVMPMLGYLLASLFASYIEVGAPIIAFVLLALIGGNMIKEALSKEEEETDDRFSFKAMIPLAFATSIDAMVAGTTLAFEEYDITAMLLSVTAIGATTFLLSALGVKVGNVFGTKYKSKAEIVGGSILICLGIYTLVDGIIDMI